MITTPRKQAPLICYRTHGDPSRIVPGECPLVAPPSSRTTLDWPHGRHGGVKGA